MPSWNIHIAHTEAVLARDCELARAVRDQNAFLFGNLLPDVRVGYMVPGVCELIPYRITHFAKPEHIPKPREGEFWQEHAARLLAAGEGSRVSARSIADERERVNHVHFPERYADGGTVPEAAPARVPEAEPSPADVLASCRDLVLGAWAHLVADNIWNTRVNEYLAAHGGKPSESFRIKKQGDFDWFGRTLKISLVPVASPRLVEAAARFPQYPVCRDDVLAAVGVAHETVRVNEGGDEHPPYLLLTDEFFSRTFAEVVDTIERLYRERAAA